MVKLINLGIDRLLMSESVKHYLSRLKPSTKRTTESILNQWLEWMAEHGGEFKDFTPDQLIEYQREHKDYAILDKVQAWVRDKESLTRGTLRRYYSAVCNLFAHSRVPFPPDVRYSIKNGKPGVQGDLKLSEIQRVIQASNPMYRAFWTCVSQGLMGIGEAIEWSNTGLDQLREDLEAGTFPIRIDFPGGRKNNPNAFYTFIGKDAITELRQYFKVRPDNDKAIFLTRYKTPLTENTARRYWIDTLHRLAIITPPDPSDYEYTGEIRYGKNVHEIRDTMRSRWRLSDADIEIAEWMMGHSDALDRYGYDKSPWHNPDHFREQYLKAEPWLNIITMDPETVPRSQYQRQTAKVEDLDIKLRGLEETVELLKQELLKRK